MKNLNWIYTIALILVTMVVTHAQPESVYQEEGDRVRVTHYYPDGAIRETGTYASNGTLDGVWMQYDTSGEVIFKAFYKQGEKEGKWFRWDEDRQTMLEMMYVNNKLASVHKWKLEQRNMLAEN